MSIADVLLVAGILAVAGWVFYRSFIRKKGGCVGCSGCASRSCDERDDDGQDHLIRRS